MSKGWFSQNFDKAMIGAFLLGMACSACVFGPQDAKMLLIGLSVSYCGWNMWGHYCGR